WAAMTAPTPTMLASASADSTRALVATAASLASGVRIGLASARTTAAGHQLLPLHVGDAQEEPDDAAGLGRRNRHHHRRAGFHHLRGARPAPAVVNQLRRVEI